MSLIKILHIVTAMNCGGLETMIMNYYRSIDREKIQFDFLVHRYERGFYDDEIEALGGRIHRVMRLDPFSRKYASALNDFFKKYRGVYRIVHCHLDCMSAVPLKYARLNGVPVRIAHSHSCSQDKDLKYLLKMLYKSQIPKQANFLFACSEEAGRWMFSGKKFEILRNAVDCGRYGYNEEKRAKVRKEFGIPDGAFAAGHVGRFSKVKNHDFLLDIFSHITKACPDSYLLLAGDGGLREKIEKKAEVLGLKSKVRFLGIRNDIWDIMQAMDVFVMPSYYEGLGIALIEAQASGLSCFVSEGLPLEGIITKDVEVISLRKSADFWAGRILASGKDSVRKQNRRELIDAGYDLTENSAVLEDFYKDKYFNEREK